MSISFKNIPVHYFAQLLQCFLLPSYFLVHVHVINSPVVRRLEEKMALDSCEVESLCGGRFGLSRHLDGLPLGDVVCSK